MAHWDEVAVTAAGEAMLNDLLAGRRLTVLSAWGGSGETDPAELAALIDVAGERHRLEILDVENGLEGKTVKVQISNSGVETGFTLHQIGVFAQVDQGPERLLCVYQDRDQRGRPGGVEVPAQAECPAFLLEFYGFLKITGGVRFEVDLSQSGAVVTPQYLTQVMEGHDQGGIILMRMPGRSTSVWGSGTAAPAGCWRGQEPSPPTMGTPPPTRPCGTKPPPWTRGCPCWS